MDHQEAVRLALAVPEAAHPHRYAPTTNGAIAVHVLRTHPRSGEATAQEIALLVSAIAATGVRSQTPYHFGGSPAGMVGGPGTWISILGGTPGRLHLSPYVADPYPGDEPPVDPSLVSRLTEDLAPLVEREGGDGSAIVLQDRGRAAFSGDMVAFKTDATPNGWEIFMGNFAHVARPYPPGVVKSLEYAAREIAAHQLHAAEIRRRIDVLHSKVIKRFSGYGLGIEPTRLVSAGIHPDGLRIQTVTPIGILGHAFEETRVLLQMSYPAMNARGSFDGYRAYRRDLERRTKLMAGRTREEALTVCPVVMRHAARLTASEAAAKKEAVLLAMAGNRDDGGKREDFREGRLTDTVPIGDHVTYRARTLLVQGATLPEAMLERLAGRPLTNVCDDERLAGLVVAKARNDAKGRLHVVTEPEDGVPLRDYLAVLDERSGSAE